MADDGVNVFADGADLLADGEEFAFDEKRVGGSCAGTFEDLGFEFVDLVVDEIDEGEIGIEADIEEGIEEATDVSADFVGIFLPGLEFFGDFRHEFLRDCKEAVLGGEEDDGAVDGLLCTGGDGAEEGEPFGSVLDTEAEIVVEKVAGGEGE